MVNCRSWFFPPGNPSPSCRRYSTPDRLQRTVDYLAQPCLEGRGLGGTGLDAATTWVEHALAEARVSPAGDAGYRQSWKWRGGDPEREMELTNLIAAIPGTDPKLPPVLVMAHLDHLGKGWPDVRTGNEGHVHPGADDNASGVAVLLELARSMAGEPARPRTVLFAAVTGEEAGRIGSKHLVAGMAAGPAPLRLHQPRHGGPARRWRALCSQRRLGARVALHLHGCRLHHRRARQGRGGTPRQLRSDELHRARDPRGPALHRTDAGLPPALRHRRHHRCRRVDRGDRSRPRGGGLSRRAVGTAHRHHQRRGGAHRSSGWCACRKRPKGEPRDHARLRFRGTRRPRPAGHARARRRKRRASSPATSSSPSMANR